MEASYFYYRPSDLTWSGTGKVGDYLDKGFNVKFVYKKNSKTPNLAIGLNDFAGTSYLSREYIVSTINLSRMNISFGLGWGKFAGEDSIKNPLSFISNKLNTRPLRSDNYKSGGTLSSDTWFRGSAEPFGGIELFIPKARGLKLKLEVDPFDYFDFSANNRPDSNFQIRKKESDINLGLSYPVNSYLTIDASFIKGNTFNLSFNLAFSFKESRDDKSKLNPLIEELDRETPSKNTFYKDLLYNLNKNSLLLQTANLDENNKKLDVSISTSKYINAIRSSSYAAQISNEVALNNEINIDHISITHVNVGVELNKITYLSSYLDNNSFAPIELVKDHTNLSTGNKNSYLDNEFRPNVKFPVLFSSTAPTLVSHIGAPEKFYFGGVAMQNVTETQFSRNLILSSEINYSIANNFEDTISGPDSDLPHVRTDVVQYLKEGELYVTNLQLDYIFSPHKEIYSRISGGIFETMFGGIGTELIYKPFKSNFIVGAEAYYVKQRDYDQKFKFRDYKTSTGHISFSYLFPRGIEAYLSYGRYLAKDDGYTFDLSKRSKSGFKAGFYFTRTNISAELFGEGSFDKGFYFQIPFDIFSKEYSSNYVNFKLSPLTRDGGAKLEYQKGLRGLIYNSTFNELNRQWDGYLD